MGTNVTASDRQRRLKQGINRLLTRLGEQGRDPNRLELRFVLDALSHLESGDWASGERAIIFAEASAAATPGQIMAVPVPVDSLNLLQLRQRLDRISCGFASDS